MIVCKMVWKSCHTESIEKGKCVASVSTRQAADRRLSLSVNGAI